MTTDGSYCVSLLYLVIIVINFNKYASSAVSDSRS